jgi:hypothetical protein
MNSSNPLQTTGPSLMGQLAVAARRNLSDRRGLFVLAAVIAATGLAFSWSWLEAVGVASVLIATLPCIAMCALGLCMHGRGGGRSCSTGSGNLRPADTPGERDVNAAGGNPAKPAQPREHEHA